MDTSGKTDVSDAPSVQTADPPSEPEKVADVSGSILLGRITMDNNTINQQH